MKVEIRLHPGSSQEKIEERNKGYEVWIREKAIDGKANLSLIKFLKNYFGKDVRLIKGLKSKNKVVEII